MKMLDSAGVTIYNEFDPYASTWLRNLMAARRITSGQVLEADIRTIQPSDVTGSRRFHAFAGIGLWDHALTLAGWPDDAPVWTGSCPCQPFSVAGRKRGQSDERHLWPEWFRLIRECRPPIVFGEQVAGPDALEWFDVVSADLEGEGYSIGSADLCAAGVGAPHIRQRLYFVAYSDGVRLQAGRILRPQHQEGNRPVNSSIMGKPHSQRRDGLDIRIQPGGPQQANAEAARSSSAGARFMGDAGGSRGGRYGRAVHGAQSQIDCIGQSAGLVADRPKFTGHTRGYWFDAEWIACRDGKARPVEPGTFPLAHGHSGRVAVVRPREQSESEASEHWYSRAGALKCIGNAIVPQVAAVFIEAAMEAIREVSQ